jgi:hypothetical protein
VNAKVEGHEEPADTPVAIEERVDCFELHVKKPGLDQGRQPRLVLVHERLERG